MSDERYATRDDVREANRDVVAAMREGFDGLNTRLDKFDERAHCVENMVTRHDERLKMVESRPSVGGMAVDWKWMSGIIAVVAGAVMGLIQGAAKVYAMIAGAPPK